MRLTSGKQRWLSICKSINVYTTLIEQRIKIIITSISADKTGKIQHLFMIKNSMNYVRLKVFQQNKDCKW